jgi:hypothetical protein
MIKFLMPQKQKARTKAGSFYLLGGFGFLGLPQGIITASY